MAYLLCHNKVADFGRWKQVFDSHAEAQRAAGLHLERLWRNLEDANEVFMLFRVHDLEKARGFIASPKVPEAQAASGLVEKPEMWFVQ